MKLHLSQVIETENAGSRPSAKIGELRGEGDSARRRIEIGFDAGQGFDAVESTSDRLSFDVVGTWELAELGAVLVLLGETLSKLSA